MTGLTVSGYTDHASGHPAQEERLSFGVQMKRTQENERDKGRGAVRKHSKTEQGKERGR